MIIKKFVARTEEEATEAARKELGSNIVIMNVRPLKKTGLFSFLKRAKIEVTVAMEEETEKNRQSASPSNNPAKENAIVRPSVNSAPVNESIGAGTLPNRNSENKILEEKLDNLHTLLEQNILKSDNSSENSNSDAPKDSSTNAVTKDKSPAKKETASQDVLSFIKILYNTLIENEVNEVYANELTDEVEKLNKPNMPFEYALSNVYQKMVLKFGKPETIEPPKEGPKTLIFIGPTGVGKTTTIAKLASKLCVMDKKKIALLTMDTYRIAAAEQLRTYASILEVPFRVIYSIDDIKQATEDFKDYDYLMIDTAGHSLHNEEQKENITSFIKTVSEKTESENFLVLSATTKYKDLLDIVDTYSSIIKYKLIFTKMDETTCAGNLYNIRLHTKAPMSYITDGQNVPDDIEVFDAQAIVKELLGGQK